MSIKTILIEKLGKKILKSATAGVAVTIGAVGVTTAIDPTLLELIPENYRGLAITLVSVAVLIARLRGEIADVIKAIRAR